MSKPIVFSDLAFKPGTTIIEESQKLALAVELAKKGYRIIIQDEKEIMNQIKLIYIRSLYIGEFLTYFASLRFFG